MKLSDPVSTVPLIGPSYVTKLAKLEIKTIEDLLLHIPRRHLDLRTTKQIKDLKVGETITITGQIISIRNVFTKTGKKMQLGKLSDGENTLDITWFNQTYLPRALPQGTFVSLAGKVSFFGRKICLLSPSYEKLLPNQKSIHSGRLVAIYPETAGVSSKWLRSRINAVLKLLPNSEYHDFLTKKSFDLVHSPSNITDFEKGRQTLALNELLALQLENSLDKIRWQKNISTQSLNISKKLINQFLKNLPFSLTPSQHRSIKEIIADLQKKIPMNRLLEGDVGSGKTIVAATASFISFLEGHQSVILAPTQILAQQHFNTLQNIFSDHKIKLSLVTSDGISDDGRVADIFIGTHALLHNKSLQLNRVAFVAIDEQHRFGVEQRAALIDKTTSKPKAPHVLTMTATPIPRSIALTLYGHLELSTLDELPKGRKPVTTWIVPPKKRKAAYQWIKDQINEHNTQVFVVCPLIDKSEADKMQNVVSAVQEHKKLTKIFKNHKVGLLHGKLKPKEKNKVLEDFKNKKLDILVTTPVIEVGVDIPNATIMIIESADRFGLAQLHQLRGRVGRSDKKSYCLLFTTNNSPKSKTRLNALRKTNLGRDLAELDLKLRGAGQIFGKNQSGHNDLKIAHWSDIDLIKKSKEIIDEAIAKPKKHKKLLDYFKSKQIVDN